MLCRTIVTLVIYTVCLVYVADKLALFHVIYDGLVILK